MFALLHQLEQVFFMKRQSAPRMLGTQIVNRTGFALHPLELHPGQLVVAAVVAHGPGIAGVALRTGNGALLPVNGKGVNFVASGLLPGMFLYDRAEELNIIIGQAVVQQRCGGVTHIYQMLIGQQVALLEIVVDGIDGIDILFGGIDGMNMGNQVRCVLVAGFGEMDFVTHPFLRSFATVARLDIKRGLDEPGGRWHLLSLTPAQCILNEGDV